MPAVLWCVRLACPTAGIALASEAGTCLAWDVNQGLQLIDRGGSVLAQSRHASPITAACHAAAGGAIAIGDDACVSWLDPDLKTRWRRTWPHRVTAVALDPFAKCLAVAGAGWIRLIDDSGRLLAEPIATARPLYRLTFVPAAPVLLGAADFGLITSFDLPSGAVRWHDNPVIHIGDLRSSGDGGVVAAACFSDGVRRYDSDGRPLATLATAQPCRHVDLTDDGRRLLVGSIFGSVAGYDDAGIVRFDQPFEHGLTGLQLAPLGDAGIVALDDGRVLALDLSSELK